MFTPHPSPPPPPPPRFAARTFTLHISLLPTHRNIFKLIPLCKALSSLQTFFFSGPPAAPLGDIFHTRSISLRHNGRRVGFSIKMLHESTPQFGRNSVQDRSGVFFLTRTSVRGFALVLVLPCHIEDGGGANMEASEEVKKKKKNKTVSHHKNRELSDCFLTSKTRRDPPQHSKSWQ